MCNQNFKKGDSCYHVRYGWGYVEKVDSGNVFATFIEKGKEVFIFLSDGRVESTDRFPMIFKTVPKIEGINKPCVMKTVTGWINIYPSDFINSKNQMTYEVRGRVNETEEEADKAALSHRFGKALKITHSALQYD